MLATDISEEALTIATNNADVILSKKRRGRISFAQGHLSTALTVPVDIIIANLPYLTPGQIAINPHLAHEPALALDGGADGLDLIRELVDHLPRVLAPGGAIGFEIDPTQATEVQRLLHHALPYHHVEIVYDLAGDERHVVAHS